MHASPNRYVEDIGLSHDSALLEKTVFKYSRLNLQVNGISKRVDVPLRGKHLCTILFYSIAQKTLLPLSIPY